MAQKPERYVDLVRNAGGVFVGEDACEALSDYVAGPSHIMPTGRSARWSSPLSARDFVRMAAVVSATPDAARRLAPIGITLEDSPATAKRSAYGKPTRPEHPGLPGPRHREPILGSPSCPDFNPTGGPNRTPVSGEPRRVDLGNPDEQRE